MISESLSFSDEPIPVDIAIDPDEGWNSEAARAWFDDMDDEDEYDGFQIVDFPL